MRGCCPERLPPDMDKLLENVTHSTVVKMIPHQSHKLSQLEPLPGFKCHLCNRISLTLPRYLALLSRLLFTGRQHTIFAHAPTASHLNLCPYTVSFSIHLRACQRKWDENERATRAPHRRRLFDWTERGGGLAEEKAGMVKFVWDDDPLSSTRAHSRPGKCSHVTCARASARARDAVP